MSRTRRVLILGTGGNCIDILDTIRDLGAGSSEPDLTCVGFLDDDESRRGQMLHGVPVLGPLASARDHGDSWLVNGIGSERNFFHKRAIIAKTGVALDRFVTVIHPTAAVSSMSELGPGCVVLQNATIASNVTIGAHVMILPGAIVSHDDRLGDCTIVTGGVCISGAVTVGEHCYLGTNAAIRSHLSIGDGSLVGMGSVVLDDVPENRVVVGNPARVLRPVRDLDG